MLFSHEYYGWMLNGCYCFCWCRCCCFDLFYFEFVFSHKHTHTHTKKSRIRFVCVFLFLVLRWFSTSRGKKKLNDIRSVFSLFHWIRRSDVHLWYKNDVWACMSCIFFYLLDLSLLFSVPFMVTTFFFLYPIFNVILLVGCCCCYCRRCRSSYCCCCCCYLTVGYSGRLIASHVYLSVWLSLFACECAPVYVFVYVKNIAHTYYSGGNSKRCGCRCCCCCASIKIALHRQDGRQYKFENRHGCYMEKT